MARFDFISCIFRAQDMVLDEKRLKPAQGMKLPEGTRVIALHPNYQPMWDAKLGSERDENMVGVYDSFFWSGGVLFFCCNGVTSLKPA